jgi:hypothetical protein
MGVMVPAVLALLAPTRVAIGPPFLAQNGLHACLGLGMVALVTWRAQTVASVCGSGHGGHSACVMCASCVMGFVCSC